MSPSAVIPVKRAAPFVTRPARVVSASSRSVRSSSSAVVEVVEDVLVVLVVCSLGLQEESRRVSAMSVRRRASLYLTIVVGIAFAIV